MPEPTQPPTPDPTPAKESSAPDETPSKPPKRPQKPTRTDSEVSTTEEMADSDDPGYQSRSRSQSRRRRRQNQRQRQAVSKAEGGGGNAESMAAVQEEEEQAPPKPQLKNPHPSDTTEMQPFERIKPPSQSMNGPVTYARAMRGEIPMRGNPPSQPLETTQGVNAGGQEKSDMMAQDGLKLRLELNLDIEIELKASIHGDLTLAIMS